MMYEIIPFVALASFALIGLGFVYVFVFRGRGAIVAGEAERRLARLAADDTKEKTTLLWHTESPTAGELRAVVIWLDGYEPIDPVRQVISRKLDAYLQTEDDVRWRESWPLGTYSDVLQASQQAFEQKLSGLQQAGWEPQLGLPFSERDRLVYLARDLSG